MYKEMKNVMIKWKNEQLTASIDYPSSFNENRMLNKLYPLVIICHGFIGSRIGVDRLFVKTANELTLDDCIVFRFDYAGCGESSGEYGSTGLTDLIEQTEKVIDFAFTLDYVDFENVFLLGHSLGGATAVLTAAKDSRIQKLIIWSAVAHPYKDIVHVIGEDKINELKDEPYIDFSSFAFTKRYLDSLKPYYPLKELVTFSGDVLILHGTSDDSIPVSYCHDYHNAFSSRGYGTSRVIEIDGADHTFSNMGHFKQLIAETKKWTLDHIIRHHERKEVKQGKY